jgi:hypothetical protein
VRDNPFPQVRISPSVRQRRHGLVASGQFEKAVRELPEWLPAKDFDQTRCDHVETYLAFVPLAGKLWP